LKLEYVVKPPMNRWQLRSEGDDHVDREIAVFPFGRILITRDVEVARLNGPLRPGHAEAFDERLE
jgi:hypothetical protein